MAVPTYVSRHVATARAANPSVTSNDPDSIVTVGSLLLCFVHADAGAGPPTVNTPSGFTEVLSGLVGSSSVQPYKLFYRVVQSGDPSSYTVSITTAATTVMQVIMTEISGASTTSPIDVSGTQLNSSTTSCTAPSITTTGSDRLLAFFGCDVNGRTYTAPSGMAEQWEERYASSPFDISAELAIESFTTAGSTGTRTATLNVATDNAGSLVAIAPAGGGGSSIPVFINHYRQQGFM